MGTIAREEGLAALWKGITAGLHRQFIYGGLRIGLYEPVCLQGFALMGVILVLCIDTSAHILLV